MKRGDASAFTHTETSSLNCRDYFVLSPVPFFNTFGKLDFLLQRHQVRCANVPMGRFGIGTTAVVPLSRPRTVALSCNFVSFKWQTPSPLAS